MALGCLSVMNLLRSIPRYSAARVDLAQYSALLVEEHTNANLSFQGYESSVRRIARDLEAGIAGLAATMEYFSLNGNVEYLPLSVYV